MGKKRLTYLDNAKGLLITMMVFGHVFLADSLVPVVNWIYTFHMPAFFIINGMLFHYSKSETKPFWKTVLKYVYTILIPLVFSEAVGVLTNIIRYGITLNIFGYIYNTIHYHFNNGPDWFLVVLFVVDVLFLGMLKFSRNKKVCAAFLVLITITAFLLPKELFILRSMGISLGCVAIGYYAFALFAKHESVWTFAVCFAVTVAVTVLNGGKNRYEGGVELYKGMVNDPVLWIIGAVAGTYFVLYAGKKIHLPALNYIGQNSLTVMITHQLFLLPFRHFSGISKFTALQGVVIFVITMLLQFPLIWVINRFLPFCVGKKRQSPRKSNV